MPNLTDLSTIRALCEKYDFALSKGFGQNFIVNPGVCPRLAESAGVTADCGVLEIGPGIGVLTKELALRAKKVVSIEVDDRLPPILAETLEGLDNVKIVLQDVLKVDLKQLIADEFAGMRVVVCANLPYYITSPILMALLEQKLPIENITVLVQKEAAERITAAPGTRQSGAISCAVAYYATPKTLFHVQPGSFYPAPKVISSVIRLDVRPNPAVQVADEKGYFALVRAAFGQRRKTAANSISSGLQLPKAQVNAALEAAGFDIRVRPEALTLQDFAAIQAALANQPSGVV
ncbi:MAG: 16S rRNA (adenine(1518)-N(6)/adenine(1519)-N(6))-dimethyltransferase RsmA [Faecalibacterium sp.]|nr:16S rRNA (adenine(1518)-N(6)/adenine(1519)-N(6))-dimethyltransferase RsmA [Faecalibacterium sp.]